MVEEKRNVMRYREVNGVGMNLLFTKKEAKRFDSKFKNKGWVGESTRHSMASYGIKTGRKPTLIVLPNGKFRHTKWNKNPTIVGTEAPKGKVPKSLLDAQTHLYAGEENISIQLINEAKREIMNKRTVNGKTVDDIDFGEMNNKAMAFSLLSDAQESINVGNSANAKLFVRQASQLLMGDYKRKGEKYHPEIEFSDGTVAIF